MTEPGQNTPPSRRLAWLGVLIPVIGLLGLVARSEWSVRTGSVWIIPIQGFDPRDLLHGRYLMYAYAFNWQGHNECGTSAGQPRLPGPRPDPSAVGAGPLLQPGCCLCLTRTKGKGTNPAVRQIDCQKAKNDCHAYVRSETVAPPQRFFVPEKRAAELEKALVDHKASIQLRARPSGSAAVVALYLDGRPCR
jgi:uncharacterized membrane-anchored protein